MDTHEWVNDHLSHAEPGLQAELAAFVDPNFGADLRAVRRNPRAIRKVLMKPAIRLIRLIDDPELLGQIAMADPRKGVRQAVNDHPRKTSIPHELRCSTCTKPSTLAEYPETVAGALEAAASLGSGQCGRVLEPLLRALHPEARQSVFTTLLELKSRVAADLLVAAAGGRLPEGLAAYDAGERYEEMRFRRQLRDALRLEVDGTDELMVLAARAGVTPEQWNYEWRHRGMLLEAGVSSSEMLRLFEHTDEQLLEVFEGLATDDRCRALRLARSQATVEAMLGILEQDPNWRAARYTARNERAALTLLSRFPTIAGKARMSLLTKLEYDAVHRLAEGELGVQPEPGEVTEVVRQLSARPGELARILRWVGRSGTDGRRPDAAELLEALIEYAPAELVLRQSSGAAKLAHARLWSELTTPEQRTVALGLLKEWEGNIAELASTAKALAG